MNQNTDSYVNKVLRRQRQYFAKPRIKHVSKWSAFWKKYCYVSAKEKTKLLLKGLLRIFGVKKCFFLGGYYEEEDLMQQLQDVEVYCELLKNERRVYEVEQKESADRCRTHTRLYVTEEIKLLLEKTQTYIALMTENLDRGGLEKVVQMLAVEYRKNEIQVKVFCTREAGHIAEELRSSGIEVIAFYGNKKAFETYIVEHTPLLVNTHYVVDFLDVLERKRIPIVEVIHNMYVYLSRDRLAKERAKSSTVTHYIAVSEAAKKIFLCKVPQVEAERITVIGNAVSVTAREIKTREQVRDLFKIPEKAFVYLAVGSIDPRKNQLGMIRAFDVVSHIIDTPICLVLAGESTDIIYEHKVLQLIRERELEKTVLLLGHCDEIQELMTAVDIFVLDSYYEGWSVAATEALYCGLPIIHSECGSGKELVASGRNGILVDNPLKHLVDYEISALNDAMHAGINDNIQQMAEVMLQMYEKRSAWQEKKSRISEYAKEEFSTKRMIEQYLSIYLKVCK